MMKIFSDDIINFFSNEIAYFFLIAAALISANVVVGIVSRLLYVLFFDSISRKLSKDLSYTSEVSVSWVGAMLFSGVTWYIASCVIILDVFYDAEFSFGLFFHWQVWGLLFITFVYVYIFYNETRTHALHKLYDLSLGCHNGNLISHLSFTHKMKKMTKSLRLPFSFFK